MSKNTAAIVTAILTVFIWFRCPVASKIHSPLVHGLAGCLIASPIYRLLKGPES